MTGTIAIVAGSGLDLTPVLDSVARVHAFSEFAGLPARGVAGHAGRFVDGQSGESRVIIQCGRLHFYEGWDHATVVRTVDILRDFGASTIVFTNAAGGLQPEMQPGDLMAADCVRIWPYRGWPGAPGALAPDLEVAGCDWRGAYHWVHGPCYETRAEIAALRAEKSSTVGMSTAPELHRAQALGIRAAAVSCITNNCCTPQHLTHDHVLRTAAAASARLCAILRAEICGGSLGTSPITRNCEPSSL